MGDVVNRGEPQPGLWLVSVRLDEMSGLTVIEIAEDMPPRVLGPERGMYLFPTRHGMADFLASGEPHSLQDVLDDVDVTSVDPEYNADFVALYSGSHTYEPDSERLSRHCVLVVAACDGAEHDPTYEDGKALVTALTTYRDEFERPGYDERDYWMGRKIQPVRLTLPSGSGVTLVAESKMETFNAVPQAFLGDYGHVVLFRDPADLLAYVRADGTDDMRLSDWWPADAPDCEPVRSVDVRTADAREWTSEAFAFLCALALVLTRRVVDLKAYKMTSDRKVRKEVERIQKVLRDVNGKVTWY